MKEKPWTGPDREVGVEDVFLHLSVFPSHSEPDLIFPKKYILKSSNMKNGWWEALMTLGWMFIRSGAANFSGCIQPVFFTSEVAAVLLEMSTPESD